MNSIRRFSIAIILSTLFIFSGVFFYYFNNQLHSSAELIVQSVRKDISSLSYALSKELTSKEQIQNYKALLTKTEVANDFIKYMMIADTNNILLSSNYKFNKLPSAEAYFIPESMNNIQILRQEKILSGEIVYFERNTRKKANIFVQIDTENVDKYLNKNTQDLVINITLIALLYLIALIYVIAKYVISPLEELRQYAYYQSEIPKRFYLKEFEYIRSSMIQTLSRLEEEKKELYNVSRTDALSGLSNREHLNERLHWLISEASRNNKEFALLFLDLDHFKTINDTLGHNIGDILLKNTASIIQNVIRSSDIVARVGGDEFVIVINHYDSILELTQVIDRIQKKINKPFVIDNQTLEVTSSIGVAFYPKDGTDKVSLMKNADIAMYQAKKDGRNQYHFFTEALHHQIQEDIQLNKEMKQALKNGEFELYYQAKNDVQTNEIVGCEALIRWNHPTKGLVPPYKFIPLAENYGFIVELGHWIMSEAMLQQVSWRDRGICDIPVSINISVKQMFHKNFEHDFKTILQSSTISHDKLDVEIVESLFLSSSHNSFQILHMFHDMDINISLDDFGTGYSSLSYLKNFPIDTLKIDKTFVDDFQDESGRIFLETIIKMGQTLKIQVLCEGVETQEQLDFLKDLGCDAYQGYLFSKPVRVHEFEKLVSKK
jgi:diguanylate cyclase (GGDEF)-like protein